MGVPGRAACVGAEPIELVAKPNDVAHDDEGGRLDTGVIHLVRERVQGALDDSLALGRPLLDERGRGSGVETVLDESRADLAKTHQPHVDDERLAGPRHRRPVEGSAPVLEVAGNEGARVRVITVGSGVFPRTRRIPLPR